MKKGPDSLVTEAMIEEVHLLIGEKDGMIFELFSEAEGDFGAVGFIDGHSGPADPEMFHFAVGRGSIEVKIGADAGDKSAGTLLELDFAASPADGNREAI